MQSGALYITLRNAQHLHLLTSAWFFFVVLWNQILKSSDRGLWRHRNPVGELNNVSPTNWIRNISNKLFTSSFTSIPTSILRNERTTIVSRLNKLHLKGKYTRYCCRVYLHSRICVISSTERRGLTCFFPIMESGPCGHAQSADGWCKRPGGRVGSKFDFTCT